MTGVEMLHRHADTLFQVVRYMALARYGNVPDVEDRISDGLVGLVEAAHRYDPNRGKGLGHFLRYVLASAAGAMRNGAQRAREKAAAEAVTTDLGLDLPGVKGLWEYREPEAEENLWVLKRPSRILDGRQVVTTTEVVQLLTGPRENREVVARMLGMDPDDESLPVVVLQMLDAVAASARQEPAWVTATRPSPEPVVNSELKPLTTRVLVNGEVVSEGTIDGISAAEAVNAASMTSVMWEPDQVEVDGHEVWLRDRKPRFGWQIAFDNRLDLPEGIIKELFRAFSGVVFAEEVFSNLGVENTGEPWALSSCGADAVETIEALSVSLAFEDDRLVERLARGLAVRLVANGLQVLTAQPGQLPSERLAEMLGEALGVDLTGAEEVHELPSAESLRPRAEVWVERVLKHPRVKPWQGAAIRALVLEGASPYQARRAAEAAWRHSAVT